MITKREGTPRAALLKQGGYQVIESETGADALRVIKEAKPSLVLLDVKLPETSGFAVCEAIKADPATAHIMVHRSRLCI
jgi:CheY-like chemotaxis protein